MRTQYRFCRHALPYRKQLKWIGVSGDCGWNLPDVTRYDGTLGKYYALRLELVASCLAPDTETANRTIFGTSGFALSYKVFKTSSGSGATWNASGISVTYGTVFTVSFIGDHLHDADVAWAVDGVAVAKPGRSFPDYMLCFTKGSTTYLPWIGRIWSLRAGNEADGYLYDVIPVILRDGTPGLWDRVSGKALENALTGTPYAP